MVNWNPRLSKIIEPSFFPTNASSPSPRASRWNISPLSAAGIVIPHFNGTTNQRRVPRLNWSAAKIFFFPTSGNLVFLSYSPPIPLFLLVAYDIADFRSILIQRSAISFAVEKRIRANETSWNKTFGKSPVATWSQSDLFYLIFNLISICTLSCTILTVLKFCPFLAIAAIFAFVEVDISQGG